MSYNMMLIAAELGIRRVVVASSVNSIGMGTSLHLTAQSPHLALRSVQRLLPLTDH